MGKAIKWLKGIFGIKIKDLETTIDGKENRDQTIGHSGRGVAAVSGGAAAALCNNPATIPPNITPAEAAWLSSFFADKEQSKHAIAVAAATAAAADAAAAAAHAAAAVARLTSQAATGGALFCRREKWAAVKIQASFRGYLARKALRCLKGLVKIQALVRGFLVRKQATATFNSMQALMRAQANIRAQKFRVKILNHQNSCPRLQSRKSIERSDESTRSGRHPSPFESLMCGNEDNPKIVEIDSAYRPNNKNRRSRRVNTWVSEPGPEPEPYGPSFSSPLSCRIPPSRTAAYGGRSFQDSDWYPADECRFSSAQSTPRYPNPNSIGSSTPTNSVCVESSCFGSFENFPNYMAKTEAFRAKLRSQSAPKQRPESEPRSGPGPKKTVLPVSQMVMESRASVSGARMRMSWSSQAQEVINFKNAILGKLDRSMEFIS